MDKYNVTLNLTQEFEIDCEGLCKWASENLNLVMEMRTDTWISFYKEGDLTPTEEEGYKSQEHYDLEQHLLSLTEEGEAVKLALPCRLKGQDYQDWEAAKKAEIAAIADFSTLTEPQKKLWMGLPLTDAEKDGLGV